MNLWASMLADLPALGQRVIARSQRISLPRGCDATTRPVRLRQALCHAATVRAVYAMLPPAAQAALQHLRSSRGGMRPSDLARHYGAVRSWRELAADPRPRTISEQLLLLGWLLPRPAAPRHPPRFLLPPELRGWLPHPLDHADQAPAPAPPVTDLPAIRATTTLLLACAERPLALTQASTLCRAELRLIVPRLAPLPAEGTAALIAWLLPLLAALDLIDTYASRATITVAGQRFLALAPEQQQVRLRDAWIRAPEPDAWLLRLRLDPRGIDWPLLRRRLCAWAQAVPAGDSRDPQVRYAALARSFGPLADAQTHGFRTVDRAPWQLARGAAVLHAALQGPLAWLGMVGESAAPIGPAIPAMHECTAAPPSSPRREGEDQATDSSMTTDAPEPAAAVSAPDHRYCMRNPPRRGGGRRRRPSKWRWPDEVQAADAPERVTPERPAADVRWRYGEPGVIVVPHAAPQAATLRLLPFARWDGVAASATRYRITPASLARALGQGWSAATCWQLLEQQAGPPPDGWRPDDRAAAPPMQIVYSAVLLADTPQVLSHASQARRVRRHLGTRLAPGIALVRPEHLAPLTRALARQAVPCAIELPPPVPTRERRHGADTPTQMNADECGKRSTIRVRAPLPATKTLPARDADADLSLGERAALVIACAHYRQYAPAHAPLLPHTGLEARLRARLTPRLNAAVDAALAELRPPPPAATIPGNAPAPLDRTIDTLRDALARQRPVELIYDTAGQGTPNTRTVRPLALDQRGGSWYLRAYCNARQAERTFRIDRISSATME